MHGRFKRLKQIFNVFQSKPRPMLGIDITSTAVKILELSGTADRPVIECYGREVFPPNVMDGHVIKDIDAVAHCIKKLVSHLHTTCTAGVLAVPDAAVISKVIQINSHLNHQEIEEMIVTEVDKYIPYPIDEINLDFTIMGHAEKNPALFNVLVVASRAEDVNNRVEAVIRAGLDALVVDVESYAVERVAQWLAKDFPVFRQDKIIAIIDLGASYTRLFVLNAMKLIYSREEKFGGTQLIKSIAERYEMTENHAAFARDQRQLPSDYESEVLAPFQENILLQIKRALQFFYSMGQEVFVNHIFLAGGLARLPGLVTLIQENLDVTATIANPLSFMSPGKKIQLDLIQDTPAFMVACGLALRNIE